MRRLRSLVPHSTAGAILTVWLAAHSFCTLPAYNPSAPNELTAMRIAHCLLFPESCGSGAAGSSGTSGLKKRVFQHGTLVTGAMGGITGADTTCNSSAQRPDVSKTYKAFLSAGGVRVACSSADCGPGSGPAQHMDWVLTANTEYYQPNFTTRMFTTNADAIFTSMEIGLPGGNTTTWTGLATNWTPGNPCGNWADGSGGVNGLVGNNDLATMGFVNDNNIPCDSAGVVLLCIEQ